MRCPQVRVDGLFPAGRPEKGTEMACPSCGKQVRVVEFRRAEGLVGFLPAHATAGTERQPRVAAPDRATPAPTARTATVAPGPGQGRSRRPAPAVRQHEWVDPEPGDRCGRGRGCAAFTWGGLRGPLFALCRRCGDCWDCAEPPPCPGTRLRSTLADRVLIPDRTAVSE